MVKEPTWRSSCWRRTASQEPTAKYDHGGQPDGRHQSTSLEVESHMSTVSSLRHCNYYSTFPAAWNKQVR
jgi:hypothetical protein